MKHARTDGPDLAFRIGRRLVSAVADDMSTAQRVGAGAVTALVAITPFGAWSEAEAQTDLLPTGAPVEAGPFELTVVKAATADELGYLVPAPGNHMLAVVADVTNTGEVPEYGVTLGSAVPAPEGVGIVPQEPLDELGTGGTDGTSETGGISETGTTGDVVTTSDGDEDGPSASTDPEDEEPDLPPATIVNIKDGTSVRMLNPGVTYRVALIWEQGGDRSGETIPLEVVRLDWIDEDALGLDDGHWSPGEVAFRGDVPVAPAEPTGDDATADPATDAEAGQ